MITITTTIQQKDGNVDVTSVGKVSPEGTEPAESETVTAGLIAAAIRATGELLANGGCGNCDECKKAGVRPSATMAQAIPV